MTDGGWWGHRNKDDSVNRDDVFDTVSHLVTLLCNRKNI